MVFLLESDHFGYAQGILYARVEWEFSIRAFLTFARSLVFSHNTNLPYSSSKEWARESAGTKTFALMEGGVGIDVGEMLNLTGSVEMPFDLNVVLIQMALSS